MAGGAIGGACVFVAAGAAGLWAGLCFSAANLAFPHQLVTEAIVTPLCVVWLYALLAAIRGRTMGLFLLAGGCLGVAILTRPVVLLMLPACFALALACPGARPELRRPGLYAMAGVALAPFLAWAAIFTVQTGHPGYNSGSANLAWNLRSKVLITENANGIDPPADVKAMEAGIPSGVFWGRCACIPCPLPRPLRWIRQPCSCAATRPRSRSTISALAAIRPVGASR
jgi:4-amino-4-deoxy-L-arabinose transferase-like glycosyltransferase